MTIERDDRVRREHGRFHEPPSKTDRRIVDVVPLDLEEERHADGVGLPRQLVPAEEDDRQRQWLYDEAAVAFVRAHPQARFLLTELILSEVATRLRARSTADRAAAVAGSLLESRRYELVLVELDVLRGAIERMRRFRDKRLSLADCASFEVMERVGIETAFTFDRDFRDCGFRMMP